MSSLGDVLRRSREAQGLSLQHVSDATHISVLYLQALESEQMDAFPADVYARGFLRSYASFLGLDAAPLLEDFQALRSPPPSENAASRRRQSRAATGRAAQRASRVARQSESDANTPTALDPSPGSEISRTRSPARANRAIPSSGPLFPYSGTRQGNRSGYGLVLLALVAAAAAAWLFGPLHGFRAIRRLGSRFEPRAPVSAPVVRRAPVKVRRAPEVPHATPRADAPLTLVLQSTGWVYIQVTSDVGKDRVYEGEWYPGLEKTWWGRKRIDVYADRGNNILATFNGKPIGRLALRRQRVWRSFPPSPSTLTTESAAGSPGAGSTGAGSPAAANPGPATGSGAGAGSGVAAAAAKTPGATGPGADGGAVSRPTTAP